MIIMGKRKEIDGNTINGDGILKDINYITLFI